MNTVDVQPILGVSDSSPDQAAQNIDTANIIQTSPDAVKQMGPALEDTLQKESIPDQATARVAQNITSGEHGAVMKDDVPVLNANETYFHHFKAQFEGYGLGRQIGDLSYKLATGDELSDDEKVQLANLKIEQRKINPDINNPAYSVFQNLPGNIAGATSDYVKGLIDNFDAYAGTMMVSTAAGAAFGLLTGPENVPAGMKMGAEFGANIAPIAAMTKDVFRQSTGQVYDALENATDANGNPLPDDERQKLARGAGVLMAGVGFGAQTAIARMMPWARSIAPGKFGQYLIQAQNAPLRAVALRLGESGIVGALAGGSNQAIKDLADETAKTFDGTEESWINGILNTDRKWEQYTPGILASMAEGAGGAVTVVGGIDLLYGARTGLREGFNAAHDAIVPAESVGPERDVGPASPLQLSETPGVTVGRDYETPNPPAPSSDITGDNLPYSVKGIRSLQLHVALAQGSDMTKDTNTSRLIPGTLTDIRKQIMNDIGQPYVYVDPEEARKFSDDPEKGARVRATIDKLGIVASQYNAPIQIPTENFLALVDQHPKASGIAKPQPEYPSGNTVADFVERVQKNQEAARDILKNVPNRASQIIEDEAVNNMSAGEKDQFNARIQGHQNHVDHETEQIAQEESALAAYNANPQGDTITIPSGATVTPDRLAENIDTRKKLLQGSQDRIAALKNYTEGSTKEMYRIQDEDIFHQKDFTDQPTFTKPIEGILSESEVKKFNEAQQRARQSVVDNINDSAKYEMSQVRDVMTQIAVNEEREAQAHAIRNDPNIQVVQDFLTNKISGTFSPEQLERIKKGRPALAINPATLNPVDRAMFAGDENLKKRGVFSKKGIPAETAATIIGVKNANELLSILSKTPDYEQAIRQAIDIRLPAIEDTAAQSVNLNTTGLAKAYNDMTANHLEEMKWMLSKEWPAARAGFKRIALPLPRISELQNQARDQVRSTPVRALNPNQWKIGAKKSQINAVNAIHRNQVERAFSEKQKAAMGEQLALETHKAVGEINRDNRFLARISTPAVQAELKEAGPTYTQAINNLLDIFNFDPSLKNKSKQDGYQKFATKTLNSGQGDYTIPPDVLSWLSDKKAADEMTVDQYRYATNKMRNVLEQARMKRTLLNKYNKSNEQMATDIISDSLHEKAIKNPEYSEKRAKKPQGALGIKQRAARVLGQAEASIINIEHQMVRMDSGDPAGLWSQTIAHSLKGTGIFADTGTGLKGAQKIGADLSKAHDTAVERIGKSDFTHYAVEKVYVPEFDRITELNNGHVTKMTLVQMLKNMGNEGNVSAVENFGISRDKVLRVLERELPKKAFEYVQGVWDINKPVGDRVVAMKKFLDGEEVQLTQPTPFMAHGQEWAGGHYQLRYANETSSQVTQSQAEKKADFTPQFNTDGFVANPFTKERTGSTRVLDLSPMNTAIMFEQVAHWLGMSVPVRDVMKIFNDPVNSKDIISTLGHEVYNTLYDQVGELTNSNLAKQMMLFSDTNRSLERLAGKLGNAAVVIQIAGNLTTTLVQFHGMSLVALNMGPSGVRHLVGTFGKMMWPMNWKHTKDYYNFAASGDPSIAAFKEGLDYQNMSTIGKSLPKDRLIKNKGWNLARNGQEGMNHWLINSLIGNVDISMKTFTFSAAYQQFLAGDVPGWDYAKVQALPDDELHAQASGYAAGINSRSLPSGTDLDRAAIQKGVWGKLLTYFWNQGRNILNSNIQHYRNFTNDLNSSFEYARQGKNEQAWEKMHGATSKALFGFVVSALGTAYLSSIRSHKKDDDETEGSISSGLLHTAMEATVNQIPGVRDVAWAIEHLSRQGTADYNNPIIQTLSDIGTTIANLPTDMNAVADFIGLYESSAHLNNQQVNALWSTTSFAVDGIAARPLGAIYKYISDPNYRDQSPVTDVTEYALGALNHLLSKNESEDDYLNRMLAQHEDRSQTERQAMMIQASGLRDQIQPVPPGAALSNQDYEVFKQTESNGKWNAQPKDKEGNALSQAFGLYQFLPGTWKDIMHAAPELYLTTKGRTSRDPAQQERAIRWFTENNARQLRAADVPVNLENLYVAHHFGAAGAVRILAAGNTTPIKSVIPEKKIEVNPQLAGMIESKQVKTVKDFMTKYIGGALQRGRNSYNASNAAENEQAQNVQNSITPAPAP